MKRAVHWLRAGAAPVAYVWASVPSGLQRILEPVRWKDLAAAEGLTREILDPLLERWAEPADASGIDAAAEAALASCGRTFAAIRGDAAHHSDECLLAVVALTANLQRTVALLAARLAQRPRPAPAGPPGPPPIRLSRDWCGVVPARPLDAQSGEDRAVAKALGCAPIEVSRRCEHALSELRRELQRGLLLAEEDWAPYATRSRAVRKKDSTGRRLSSTG